MGATLLRSPPDDGHLWIPPGSLGPDIEIWYTLGRNDGNYLNRKTRGIICMEISHTMGGAGTESMQGFANSEMGDSATLAELATFTDGKVLESLPLDKIGTGSVAGCATGITHESAEEAGDVNTKPWNPVHCRTKAKLTAFLINNPLAKAGDRKWNMLQIPYQIIRNPYASSRANGGLGYHTMWDLCGIQAGGSNPWSLYCKNCPAWYRRATNRPLAFPNSVITDIPIAVGNFRDYYQQVGVNLTDGPPPPVGDDDMLCLVHVTDTGDNATFLGMGAKVKSGHIWLHTIEWLKTGNVAAPYQEEAEKMDVVRQALLNCVCLGDVPPNWSDKDGVHFRQVLKDAPVMAGVEKHTHPASFTGGTVAIGENS